MANLKVDIVSVDTPFWNGEAKSATLQSTEGEIGFLFGHEPMLGQLAEDGMVSVRMENDQLQYLAISGGFFSIDGSHLIILAEDAIWVDDIVLADEEKKLNSELVGSFEYLKAKGRVRTFNRVKK